MTLDKALHKARHEPGGVDALTALTASSFAAASVDGTAGTASLRTLGTASTQAAAGNDSRLSDTRTPSALSVVDSMVSASAAIAESKLSLASDAAAGTASRRTLGTSSTQAAQGSDAENAFSTYKTLRQAHGRFASAVTTGTYLFPGNGGGMNIVTGNADTCPVWYLDPASYAAGSRTVKYRVVVMHATNATGPAVTLTVGFYPVLSVLGAISTTTYTLDTVVTGSTVAFASQAASTLGNGNSGDFTAPAAGYYTLGCLNSGTTAVNSNSVLDAVLQVRQV